MKFKIRILPLALAYLRAGAASAALALLATALLGQPAFAAGVQTHLSGVIPPPDEEHAMHKIGVCGSAHYEPRLEFCDARDNQVYRYVKIGPQVWMAENLNFGTAIPGSENQTKPGQKYCLYDMASDCAALYQWAEAAGLDFRFNAQRASLAGNVQGVCPAGWHLPHSAEWEALLAFVDQHQGRDHEAVSLMYFSHDDHFKWKTNTDPDQMMPKNLYGFEAISTGIRVLKAGCPVGHGNDTFFCNAHDRAAFWTSDDNAVGQTVQAAVDFSFIEDVPQIKKETGVHNLVQCPPGKFGVNGCGWNEAQKIYGMSVRCVQTQDAADKS